MKKVNRLDVNPQKGVYIGIPAPANTANQLMNWKYDSKTKAWSNELGYEKYFSSRSNFGDFAGGAQRKIDSIYNWSQHSGARQSLLFETNGTLYEINGSTTGFDTLLENRHIPNDTDYFTHYSPYSRYLIITNGFDGPVKYRASRGGSDRIFDLGWRNIPGTPQPSSVGSPDGKPKTFIEATSAPVIDQTWGSVDYDFRGVTGDTAGDKSIYRYKVSFVNEAGSESPLSNASAAVTYTAKSVTRGATTGVPLTGFIIEIPRGPAGTIARRIYRTKNDGSIFYFVSQVHENTSRTYTDFMSDSQLGAEAPLPSESIVMPSPACRFSATFKDCLFIDGGMMNAQNIFYSQPRQPDTYSVDNYFNVGTTSGGDITGLYPYYNALIVFREDAIDLIRTNALGRFELVPFIQGVGCESPHSIVAIPNMGLSFLSKDGIYLINGGLDGGADLTLNKISLGLEEYFDRATIDKLPQAVANYSSRERELHYYMSIDGKTFLSQGLVYHIDSQTWSERNEFPVRCITVDKDGNFICGYDENFVYNGAPANPPAGSPAKGGLFVISGQRTSGYEFTGAGKNIQQAQPLLAKFRSAWLDFGDITIKKQVKYVYLTVLTHGNAACTMFAYKDRDWSDGTEVETHVMQRPDHKDQPVYDDQLYVWDTAHWQDKLLTRIRFDVANMSCSEFAFEFETTDPMEFIGYQIEYTADGTKIIGGKR